MISISGLTDVLADDTRPTYLPFPLISKKWKTTLDYIFYRVPAGEYFNISADIIPVVNSFARRHSRRFLTDHHALLINIG
jgi:hypothetical protein